MHVPSAGAGGFQAGQENRTVFTEGNDVKENIKKH